MSKEPFTWNSELISGMTTEAIAAKMRELVPAFTLDSFITKTGNYDSCEDFSEAEYYPEAKFSDLDEDFIWMACEELWKRLVPGRPAVEHICQKFEALIEAMLKAEENKRWKESFRRSREALDLLSRYAIEDTLNGRRLRRDYFDKLRDTSADNFEVLLDDLFINLRGNEEYELVVENAGIFGDGLADDSFLSYKAESLFALGRKEEAESLYQEIIDRNPDDILFLLNAGDCYINYGEKDVTTAKNFYLKAQNMAEKHRNQVEGKVKLLSVYGRLFELARDTNDYAEADRYGRLFLSLKEKKVGRNDPCPCGSGKKYKKCCGRNTGEP
jgi:tetratricopeptide (TPR) repeat protein